MTNVMVDSALMTQADVAEAVNEAVSHPSVAAFHALWYHAKTTWSMTRYKGVPMLKCGLDMQIYHELIWQIRPTLIIETGTCFGGSALWFADQLDMLGRGRVVSIDLEDKRQPDVVNPDNAWPDPQHPRIEWIVGSSLDPAIVGRVRQMADEAGGPVMVSLDSDHHEAHVRQELATYAPMVTVGSMCVVEDTNISDRPLHCETDPGPGAAVEWWLGEHPEFQINPLCHRMLLTMHPDGWLQRVR